MTKRQPSGTDPPSRGISVTTEQALLIQRLDRVAAPGRDTERLRHELITRLLYLGDHGVPVPPEHVLWAATPDKIRENWWAAERTYARRHDRRWVRALEDDEERTKALAAYKRDGKPEGSEIWAGQWPPGSDQDLAAVTKTLLSWHEPDCDGTGLTCPRRVWGSPGHCTKACKQEAYRKRKQGSAP